MLLFFPFTLKIFFLKISPRLLETNDVSVLFFPVSQLITGQCIYERDRFHFKKKKDLRLLNSSRFNKNCNFTRQIRTRKFKLQTVLFLFPVTFLLSFVNPFPLSFVLFLLHVLQICVTHRSFARNFLSFYIRILFTSNKT